MKKNVPKFLEEELDSQVLKHIRKKNQNWKKNSIHVSSVRAYKKKFQKTYVIHKSYEEN
jgi:hypothetical protein